MRVLPTVLSELPPLVTWLGEVIPPPQGIVSPLSHHALLILLLQLALLLLAARGLGELMRWINLPLVIGELLAGVALGPSLFGSVFPRFHEEIFPTSQNQSDLLSVVAWLGVLFLLVITGLETNLDLIIRKGKTAMLVSIGGIVIPFITGFGLGQILPDSFLADPAERLGFSLFIATAMSISAVPVIAKVLMDLKLIRRDIGQVILAAGMTDDTIGWILLSVVSGVVRSGQFDWKTVVQSVSGAVLFLGLSFTLGRIAVDSILRWVDEHIGGSTAGLSIALVLAFAGAALTHSLGIEAALGAFVLGILLGQSRRFHRDVGHTLEMITGGFLAPIFFASAGLKVDLLQLAKPDVFAIGLLVLAVACFGKMLGAYLGSRAGGLSHWEGLAMGSGMNARGAMEIIVATIGLSLGVLNQQMYSIIVMVAIVTSLLAPSLLRWTLSHVEIGEEEAARLVQESHASRSFIKNIRRVLMPSRGGTNIQLAAQLVSYLSHYTPLEITALFAANDHKTQTPQQQATAIKEMERALAAVSEEVNLPTGRSFQTKVVESASPSEVIIKEAAKGYDLLVLGATEQQRPSVALFSPLVDQIIREVPCATLVVKSHLPMPQGDFCPIPSHPIRHILVPTIGSKPSRNAVELASTIASQTGAILTLIHVISVPQVEYILYEQESLDPVQEIAQEIVEYQAQIGRRMGAEVAVQILEGTSPEQRILDFVHQERVDFIILGSTIRMLTGRAFLGHRVDTIVRRAPCPVAVLSSPT